MAQHGGNNVDDNQVLALTREIATVGTNVTTLLESFKEFKKELTTNYTTKAETKAMKEAHEREMQALKETHEKEMKLVREETKSIRDDMEKLKNDIDEENENRKEAPYKNWMLVASVAAVASVIISAISLIHVWSK